MSSMIPRIFSSSLWIIALLVPFTNSALIEISNSIGFSIPDAVYPIRYLVLIFIGCNFTYFLLFSIVRILNHPNISNSPCIILYPAYIRRIMILLYIIFVIIYLFSIEGFHGSDIIELIRISCIVSATLFGISTPASHDSSTTLSEAKEIKPMRSSTGLDLKWADDVLSARDSNSLESHHDAQIPDANSGSLGRYPGNPNE